MDRSVYTRMGEQEAEHWWFRGRRAVLEALIRRCCALPTDARILEAGCGTGGNLEMLVRHGAVDAFEYDADARAVATRKGIAAVESGALPDDVTAPEGAYDLIALFDVLEHIEQDHASLATLARKLRPGGRLLISVPAMPWLWSRHDEIHHHKRRYTRATLAAALAAGGLQAERIGYFNSLLFPLAVAQRLGQRLTGHDAPADAMPAGWLNGGLATVFRSERFLVGRVPMPVGLSLYAVAVRRA